MLRDLKTSLATLTPVSRLRDPSQIAQTALHEGRTVGLPLVLIVYSSIPSDVVRGVGDVGLQW